MVVSIPSPNPGTRYHILGGGKITTLASGIDASALSFTVNDASGWPGVSGPGAFWVVADAFTPTEEKMLCTSRTGNVVTVTTRGVDGTSAVAHTANTGNWYPVIAAGIIDPLNEHAASSSAVHGVAGSVVGTTDTQTVSAKTLNTATINSPTVSGTVAGGATYTTPTLTTPVIASFASATHNHSNAAGGGSTLSSPTITTPTIADFTNAGHNHSNAAGGGGISVTDFTNSNHDHGDADDGGALATSITLTTPTIASFTNATHNHSNAAGGGSALTPATVVTTGIVTSGGDLTMGANTVKANKVPRGRIFKAATQSVTDNTYTAMTFPSEDYDSHGQHDTATNNTRVTPNKAGLYFVVGQVSWASNSTGHRDARITKNGTTSQGVVQLQSISGVATIVQVNAYVICNGSTDYFELEGRQNSGGALNANGGALDDTALSWHWVADDGTSS